MKKKNFTPPTLTIYSIKQENVLLVGTPPSIPSGSGGGSLPPSDNNNDDNDW